MSTDDAYPIGPPRTPTPEELARHKQLAEANLERIRRIEQGLKVEPAIVDDRDQRWIGEQA